MKHLPTLLIVFLLLNVSLFSIAQSNSGTIKGHVNDGSNVPMQAATVTLLRSSDSAVVKLTVTSKEGNFTFTTLPGKYIVTVSAVGFAKASSGEIILIDGGEKQLTAFALTAASKDLKAVTVSGKKALVEQKLDRMIVNVDAAVSNVGATALEVLEKSPGISIDKDGNISLKGKAGVTVYIDGRPSYLSGTDLANLLRNMNASQLDQIEIMTNPPAKYDAAGNSGIINIKTKKTKTMGYNGSLSLGYGQGKYPKLNESLNFNYRKNKINLFTNIGYSYRQNFNNLDIQRKFMDAGTKELKSHFEQESRMRDHGESMNAKVGMDFYATKKSTFGVVLGGFSNPGTFRNSSDVNIYDVSKVLQSITRANTRNERSWKNYSTNLNYRFVFDSTGREITADADYLGYRSKNNQLLINSYFDAGGQASEVPDSLKGNLPQNINIYSAKVDYVHPLKKGAKFEAGIKSSFVKTDNNASYDSIQNGQDVHDTRRSNHFIYQENVNAAYANYSRPLTKRLSGQFGLRLEHTNAKGNQVSTNESFSRNYVQLFPTAYLQFTADKNNSFVLNYGRRIQRPNYEDLNPFILFLDRYTFEQGNPNLKPQFAHNIELSHTFKGTFTTTLNYTNTTDIITEVLEQNAERNETFVIPRNIATQRQYGISVSAGVPVTKWWTANLWANVYNNEFTGIVNNDKIKLGATTGQFNLSNQIKLSKTISAEVSGFYRTPGVDGVFKIQGFGMVNAGISQQIMKGKGSVRLSIRDAFYTQKIDGSSKFSNIDATFQQSRESRVVSANFTYRFSKGKANNARKRASSASDEQNRIKVDGGN
ncbi:MAG: TonB-dependent receptor [Chitinophagaceae bacterium]|nr:TonB-dependent receptor [Chitinophagaceae bacterium]